MMNVLLMILYAVVGYGMFPALIIFAIASR